MASVSSAARPAILIISLVVLVTATSFGISRLLINNSIAEAKPLADQREAQRTQLREAERQQEAVQARRDTLSRLLTILEERLQSNPADSMLLISAGNIAYDLQQYAHAERHYKTFLDNFTRNQTSVKIDYGFAVFQNGNKQEGIRILKSVITTEPTNQTALFNLAYMYQQLDEIDNTRKLLTACRDVDPASAIGQNANQALQALNNQ